MSRNTLSRYALFLATMLLLIATPAFGGLNQGIQSRIEPSKPVLNQPFRWIIDIKGSTLITQHPIVQGKMPSALTFLGIQHHLNETQDNKKIRIQQQWVLTFISRKSGKMTLPAVRIGPYVAKSITLTIAPSTQSENLHENQTKPKQYQDETPQAYTSPRARAYPEYTLSHNLFFNRFGSALSSLLSSNWIIYPLLFLLGLTFLGRLASRRGRESILNQPHNHEKRHYLEENIFQACQKNNTYDCVKALKAWSRIRFPKANTQNLKSIATQVRDEAFKQAILDLNARFMKKDKSPFDGRRFWQAFSQEKNAR